MLKNPPSGTRSGSVSSSQKASKPLETKLSRIWSQYHSRAAGLVLSIRAPARSLRTGRPYWGLPSASFSSQPFDASMS